MTTFPSEEFFCLKANRPSRMVDARCMTDIIRVCEACHADRWDPNFDKNHPAKK